MNRLSQKIYLKTHFPKSKDMADWLVEKRHILLESGLVEQLPQQSWSRMIMASQSKKKMWWTIEVEYNHHPQAYKF